MSQQINLLNPLFLRQQKYFSAVAMLQSLGLLLLGSGIAAGVLLFERGRLDRQVNETEKLHKVQEERFRKLSFELSPDRAEQELNASLKSADEQLAARRALLERLGAGASGPPAGYSPLLQALSRQSVEGLWLTVVRVESGSQQITLAGHARTPDLISPYVDRLGTEPLLKGRFFRKLELTRRPDAGAPLQSVEFVLITSELNPGQPQQVAGAGGAQKVQP